MINDIFRARNIVIVITRYTFCLFITIPLSFNGLDIMTLFVITLEKYEYKGIMFFFVFSA